VNPPAIDQQITFLYTRDLAATAQFYEGILGLKIALDQGDCRIY
jgi:catechol 2,3-dioxygenase-like lactoylglutathione lyase family enzyme